MAKSEDSSGAIPLPPELARLLGGEGVSLIPMDVLRQREQDELKKNIPVVGLDYDKARWLLEGAQYKPQAGDVVVMREDSPFPVDHNWPIMGEECVVTTVMQDSDGVVMHEVGDGRPVARDNITLGFVHRCGKGSCDGEGALAEYLHDSRFYRRVGSIWEGYQPKPRPKVPGMDE